MISAYTHKAENHKQSTNTNVEKSAVATSKGKPSTKTKHQHTEAACKTNIRIYVENSRWRFSSSIWFIFIHIAYVSLSVFQIWCIKLAMTTFIVTRIGELTVLHAFCAKRYKRPSSSLGFLNAQTKSILRVLYRNTNIWRYIVFESSNGTCITPKWNYDFVINEHFA